MGFKKSLKIPHTDKFATESYTNIGAFRYDTPGRFYVRLDTYYSKAKCDAGEKPMSSDEITDSVIDIFESKANISMPSIYSAIKLISEKWADAVDVYEPDDPNALPPETVEPTE